MENKKRRFGGALRGPRMIEISKRNCMSNRQTRKRKLTGILAGVLLLAVAGSLPVGPVYADTPRVDSQQTVVRSALVNQCETALAGAAVQAEAAGQSILGAQEDREQLLQILTAECGRSRSLSMAVVQALYNSCAKRNWQYTPLEIAKKDG